MKKNIIALTFIVASLQGCSSLPQAAIAMTPLGAAMTKVQINNAIRQGEVYSKAMKRQQKLGKVMPVINAIPATQPQATTNSGAVLKTLLDFAPLFF